MNEWDDLFELQRSDRWRKKIEKELELIGSVKCPTCGEMVLRNVLKCPKCGTCVRCDN